MEDTGNAGEVSQSEGKTSAITAGDSLVRYLVRLRWCRVKVNYCFPGTGIRQIAVKLD